MTTRPPRHDTPEARAKLWALWNAAPPHLRTMVGLPPCYTCGRPAEGTFRDGSPRFGHYHPRSEQPQ